MIIKVHAGNNFLTILEKEVKISAFKMVERSSVFTSQLKAMIIRNVLLKKREKRKTLAEILLPLYFLGILILIKLVIPNPNFPVMDSPRGEARLFEHFNKFKNHTLAVVPNATEAQTFMELVNTLWQTMHKEPGVQPISFLYFETPEELSRAYWAEPTSIPIAIVFASDPMLPGRLEYEIRTNPTFNATPPTGELFVSPAVCRQGTGHWSGVIPIETGNSCPVNKYYYSGFVAVQALLDYTKIRLDSDRSDIEVPDIQLELLPKEAYTGGWMVAFRVVIPLYMVMALSQFITYLLILIVGEKENKIKEGMKIMGLRDSVFWLSWFIIYGVFVLFLTIISTVLLFTLQVFQHTNFILVFLLILLYALSIIMFGFMLTPFFDKSRTAGILGNFAVNIMSLLYFIQVFVDDSSSSAFWFVSLISSSGFALAMDKALVLDLSGEGVSFDNLWSGPGIPFGGSLIMMSFDIVLYGFLAYYLDCVIPSEHGTKRKPWFCFTPSFWCSRKVAPRHNHKPTTPDARTKLNGDFTSMNAISAMRRGNGRDAGEEERVGLGVSDGGIEGDVEQVPREMKGREAIQIVDLHKRFHACRKPEVKAVNGINLTIYEGQITAILGHNGAGKTTLFNILTGLTAPTSGTAFVFGYDIRDQNDMSTIRRMTGVCPQHDHLFDFLTPREHLEFFAAVRGIPAASVEQEVVKTLQDIDLLDKANTFAKYLSGGQKRKLSVGIAVIGDPKIIILDEPTAGVDPYSRRHMWSVLQNRRHGKVILLTTHFMDEADILADRKAVVSRGRLRCCGSSLFLKNKFGIGYHLTLVLDSNGRENAITRLVTMHVGKAEKARRHGRELSFILPHDSVDSFAVLFSAIEEDINNRGRLGISSYGVSMTTLEEVFLHLEKDEETEDTMDNLSKKMVRSRALSRSLSLQSRTSYQSLQEEVGNVGLGNSGAGTSGSTSAAYSEGGTNNMGSSAHSGTSQKPHHTRTRSGTSAEAVAAERAGMVSVLERVSETVGPNSEGTNSWQAARALLWLRLLRMGRDIQLLYFMIALPLGFAVLGLYLNGIQVGNSRMKPLVLNGETYQNATKLAFHNGTGHQLDAFTTALRGQTYGRPLSTYDGNFSHLLNMWPHLGALSISTFDVTLINVSSILDEYIDGPEPSSISLTAIYNDTAQHSLPIVINLINNAIYRMVVNPEDKNIYPIIVKSHPFQLTSQPAEFNGGSFSSSLLIGMIFVLVPISLAVDMVYDREVKAKNQLRVNGLSPIIYFITYFVILATLMLLICVVLLALIPALDPPALRPIPAFCTLGALCLLCCPASVLSAAAASYLFDRADSAQSILPNVAAVVGLAPFILVAGLDMLNIGGGGGSGDERNSVVFGLHVFLSLVDPMYIPYAIVYFVNRVYVSCEVNAACAALSFSDYATDEILVILVSTIFHAPVCLLLLVVLDVRKGGGRVSDIFAYFKCTKKAPVSEDIVENNDIGSHEDTDVKAERQKVAQLLSSNVVQPPVVILQNLRKEYQKSPLGIFESCTRCACCGSGNDGEGGEGTGEAGGDGTHGRKVAVRNLSLAVDAGEVFGLLGHNGAGKTTTMKIMIAEEAPTRGRVQIGGHNITSNIAEAFQLMGYCPQHDALWKNITVREHLELYAAIRGVPPIDIPIVVDAYLTGLQIHEHANKQSHQCSGGTRRKLSYAMAMVGGPKVVLMDEPSTGMDPRSKRFLWDTILASFQGTRGAILTTHSMEEADALCSRVGIMVQGELRCLGSTQHLKNLYGAGYTLEMKVRGGDSTPTASVTDRQAGLRAFVSSLFPDATVEESFADRLVFCVPQHAVTSLAQCFTQLEKAKVELDIEEYSFSQTTLEQVFLKFAHYDEVSDD
ncbi:cholesterol transporter ABCA5-like [Hetaerina americana]|uniref:cholesterol transporter ABCA5-like n=1 Tax=Hetaerina americana TaxID=62018 RepID=UPI003A7F39B4